MTPRVALEREDLELVVAEPERQRMKANPQGERVTQLVFVLSMGEGALTAFPDARQAEGHCNGLDVEDGIWLFFAEDGSPLEARFERPNRRGPFTVSGIYRLQRALSGRWLQERLHDVKTVEGCGVSTIAELVEFLKVNRGKRVQSDGIGRRDERA